MATTEELARAVDGIRFIYAGRFPMGLVGGLYGNGRAAVQIVNLLDGSPYSVLTVNLVGETLAPDEVHVRVGNDAKTDFVALRTAIRSLHIFEPTSAFVDSGFVRDYAAVWRFARCRSGRKEGHTGGYVVMCDGCRKRIADTFEAKMETLLAQDAVKRLSRGGDHSDPGRIIP